MSSKNEIREWVKENRQALTQKQEMEWNDAICVLDGVALVLDFGSLGKQALAAFSAAAADDVRSVLFSNISNCGIFNYFFSFK